jgi:hypothetical protein
MKTNIPEEYSMKRLEYEKTYMERMKAAIARRIEKMIKERKGE